MQAPCPPQRGATGVQAPCGHGSVPRGPPWRHRRVRSRPRGPRRSKAPGNGDMGAGDSSPPPPRAGATLVAAASSARASMPRCRAAPTADGARGAAAGRAAGAAPDRDVSSAGAVAASAAGGRAAALAGHAHAARAYDTWTGAPPSPSPPPPGRPPLSRHGLRSRCPPRSRSCSVCGRWPARPLARALPPLDMDFTAAPHKPRLTKSNAPIPENTVHTHTLRHAVLNRTCGHQSSHATKHRTSSLSRL